MPPRLIARLGGLALSGFLIVTITLLTGIVVEIDRLAYQMVASWRYGCDSIDRIASAVTTIGDFTGLAGVVVVATVILVLRRQWAVSSLPMSAVFFSYLSNQALKRLFTRPRPDWPGILLTFTPWDWHSFPSGHAMTTAALYAVLIYCFWDVGTGIRRVMLLGVLSLQPVIVGLSRVVLEVHWLSDVVAGWLAGLVVASVAVLIGNSRTKLVQDDDDSSSDVALKGGT